MCVVCVCCSVCCSVCVCVCWPGNQKFPCSMAFTHIAPVYPAVFWGPGDLMSSGEAAHPAVTSMWYRVFTGEANAQLSFCLA